jgi:hypothetical protein
VFCSHSPIFSKNGCLNYTFNLLRAAPEKSAAAAKPAISAIGTNCLKTTKMINKSTIITRIFTASALSKLIKIAEGSFLLLLRLAINDAAYAPIITLEPPKTAEIPAYNPDKISAIIATAAVAITWILSILLKTSVVVDADNGLNPVKLNTNFIYKRVKFLFLRYLQTCLRTAKFFA